MKINREELAWAAGFHDGEGCFSLDKGSGKRRPAVTFAISNTHRPALVRFMDAVGQPRKIYSVPEKRARRQIYRYAVRSFEGAQAIAAALWPFLCEEKREQILRVFHDYHVLVKQNPRRFGDLHPQARLTWEKVRDIRARIAAGAPLKEISADTGISSSNLSSIKAGHTWRNDPGL